MKTSNFPMIFPLKPKNVQGKIPQMNTGDLPSCIRPVELPIQALLGRLSGVLCHSQVLGVIGSHWRVQGGYN